MKSVEFLDEGINDKGIFKVVFMAGTPGSGKSTVIDKVSNASVKPRILDIDKSFEHVSTKDGRNADDIAWMLFGKKSLGMHKQLLYDSLNSMLPMFIDGTGANPKTLLHRESILTSMGYDTMMIWVDTDLETANERMKDRPRKLDNDLIKQFYNRVMGAKNEYKAHFGSDFIEIDNNGDNFELIQSRVYNQVNQFFNSAIENPNGKRNLQAMQDRGIKYLTDLIPGSLIKNSVNTWWYK